MPKKRKTGGVEGGEGRWGRRGKRRAPAAAAAAAALAAAAAAQHLSSSAPPQDKSPSSVRWCLCCPRLSLHFSLHSCIYPSSVYSLIPSDLLSCIIWKSLLTSVKCRLTLSMRKYASYAQHLPVTPEHSSLYPAKSCLSLAPLSTSLLPVLPDLSHLLLPLS